MVTKKEYIKDIERQENETEEEYNKNNKIIKIRAKLQNNQLIIEHLDKRKFSKGELEKRKPLISGSLIACCLPNISLNEQRDISAIFYLDMGEPKYVIKDKSGNDKEVSKQEFEEYRNKIKKDKQNDK